MNTWTYEIKFIACGDMAKAPCVWRPLDHEHFRPVDGMLASHDVLDHFPHHTGTETDELLAIGAMIYTYNHDMTALVEGSFERVNKGQDSIDPNPPCLFEITEVNHRGYIDRFRRKHKDSHKVIIACLWLIEGYRQACERYAGVERKDFIKSRGMLEGLVNRAGSSEKVVEYTNGHGNTRTKTLRTYDLQEGDILTLTLTKRKDSVDNKYIIDVDSFLERIER